MGTKVSILYLEDDPIGIRLVSKKITSAFPDAVLKSVRRKEEFIKSIEMEEFDCIIVDYTLPDINGIEALQLIKETVPITPAIVFTGSVGEEKAVECIKAGAFDYILKTHPERLIPAIHSALQHKHEQEELTKVLKELQNAFSQLQQKIPVTRAQAKVKELNERFSEINKLIDNALYTLKKAYTTFSEGEK